MALKKKEIKAFFSAIRNYDLHKLREALDANAEYITATNFAPPKKDDGQSGLQVAFKVANFDAALCLIERGADVNFMEKSDINEWRAPVLHDCIRAALFNCLTLEKDPSEFDKAIALLKTMLSKGANPNARDSYGNSCLNRAIIDAAQMIDNPLFFDATRSTGEDLSEAERELALTQIRGVFAALINAGADVNAASDTRKSAVEHVRFNRIEQYALF